MGFPRRLLGRGYAGPRKALGWAFVDQGLASATNFGLSVLAGRLLGPRGLGTVFLAFSVYLIVLVLQRALVTETLLVVTSALDREQRARTARIGLTMSLLGGSAATTLVVGLGLIVPGVTGTALLLVAPWLVGSLIQDFWRSLLFRDGRPAAAAANDGLWLLVMVIALPIGWVFRTEAAVVAVWGLGAWAAAVFGLWQLKLIPFPVRKAWGWWLANAWPFGRWNAATAIIPPVGSNVEAFVLVGIIGARALGGFRAVQSLFAPLSVIAPAVGLPGLPAIARAYSVEFRRARSLAFRISGIAVAASCAFFLFLVLGGWRLLPLLFGPSFLRYRDLMLPVAVGQVFAAAGVGFPLLIKVQQRGRFLLLSRLFVTVVGLGLVTVGALRYGLDGAVWATAAWALLTTLTLGLGALRDPRPGSRRARRSEEMHDPTAATGLD